MVSVLRTTGAAAPSICDPPRPKARMSRSLLSREDRAGVLALRRREGLRFLKLSAATEIREATHVKETAKEPDRYAADETKETETDRKFSDVDGRTLRSPEERDGPPENEAHQIAENEDQSDRRFQYTARDALDYPQGRSSARWRSFLSDLELKGSEAFQVVHEPRWEAPAPDEIKPELAGCSLSDVLLDSRLARLVSQISEPLGQSTPVAYQDWANTEAPYRFIDNPRVH